MMNDAENNRTNGKTGPHAISRLEIPESELNAFQAIVDLVARVAGARAGLIMRVEEGEISALTVSDSQGNPYRVGDAEELFGSGLYCERVIRNDKMLLVSNALETAGWENNPDLKYGMLCYLGFPIHLPDGSPFGTICVLDDKENSFTPTIVELMERMRDLIESQLRLMQLNAYDSLTGLYNRAFIHKIILHEMSRADRYHAPIAMLMLDIDHFKQVNDGFGHLAGDGVLRHCARVLAETTRGTDIVARYGGEEFVVLLPNTTVRQAANAAERIRALMERTDWPFCGKVTISIGAAEYLPGESFEDWFTRADVALYRAKSNGRNQVVACGGRDGVPMASVHFEWKSEWVSTHEQIDGEHRKLLELGNELINVSLSGKSSDKVMGKLEALLAHIVSHFENEEEILSDIGYPDVEEHKALHRDLTAKSLSLKEGYLAGNVRQSAFFSFIVDDVVVGHLEKEDSKFFPHVRGAAKSDAGGTC